MKYAADLHIHSALSPCSDNDMTPNNIVNMALLKGLDIIAVTDHNTVANCPAVAECARRQGILAVPGMELESIEEVHLICLFPDMKAAYEMQDIVFEALPDFQNREDVFGEQLIMDENDEITGREKRLLLTAAVLSIEDVFGIVKGMGGMVIPAHIDRDSYSIISNLGMIPGHYDIACLELSRSCSLAGFTERNPELRDFYFLKSSDAHRLGDILERDTLIELRELSISCLFETLRAGCKERG